MIEHTQTSRPGEVEVLKAVAVGDNVLHTGEDVAAGEEVISSGVRLRPAEIGGLMALGIDQVHVHSRPKVGIISSGDEIKPPGRTLGPGEVYDVNTFTLSALITEAGGEPRSYGIIMDNETALLAAAKKALAETDLVVLTAGSSVSTRDLTARVIQALGEPGVLVHGVSVRPGKPTILGLCAGKPVIGLPGNPVSALVIASLFVVPVVEALLGVEKRRPAATVPARLMLNVASQAGREDWVPVRLLTDQEGYLADPVFGKSNLIFTLARADGLVRIPPDATGLEVGSPVQVMIL
jgi:molybdopterin molybdotransferase